MGRDTVAATFRIFCSGPQKHEKKNSMTRKKPDKKSAGKMLQVTVKDLKVKKDARGGAACGGVRLTSMGGGAPWGARYSSTPSKS